MDKQKLLVVIHDTIVSKEELFAVVQSKYNEIYYHSIINVDGEIIYCVQPNIRIPASNPSSFNGEQINGSVDDFAYHICLIGENYSNDQYFSLGWLCKQLQVEEDRIVGHSEIDLSGLRKDPKSLNKERVISIMNKCKLQKPISWEP